jgi:hypothetical protein
MKLFAIALLVCGIGLPLRGADNDTTNGLLNGRFWVGMSGKPSERKGGLVAKWIFLSGVKTRSERRRRERLIHTSPRI